MTIRLYVDEDAMDKALVIALRARGVDVQTAREAGLIERKDQSHLEYSTEEGRVLYGFNVGDYLRLHSEFVTQGRAHTGVVLARQQYYSIGEQVRRLLRLIAAVQAEEMTNRVEFLIAWGLTSDN